MNDYWTGSWYTIVSWGDTFSGERVNLATVAFRQGNLDSYKISDNWDRLQAFFNYEKATVDNIQESVTQVLCPELDIDTVIWHVKSYRSWLQFTELQPIAGSVDSPIADFVARSFLFPGNHCVR